MIADEQIEIAENSDVCTGEMDWVMDRGRDHWNCNCEKYSEMSPWKVDDPERPDIPLHPNCMCEWRPRLKTDEEIIAAFREEMKEELDVIDGSEWQKDMLEQIDKLEKSEVELVIPGIDAMEKLSTGEKADIHLSPVQLTPVADCKTFDEFQNYMKKHFNVNIDERLRNCDIKAMTESASGFESIMNEFTDLRQSFAGIMVTEDPRGVMSFIPDEKISKGFLCYNPDVYKDYNKAIERSGNIQGSGIHEAVHLAELFLLNRNNPSMTLADKKNAWVNGDEASKIINEAIRIAQNTPEGKNMPGFLLKKRIDDVHFYKSSEVLSNGIKDCKLNGDNADFMSKIIYNQFIIAMRLK